MRKIVLLVIAIAFTSAYGEEVGSRLQPCHHSEVNKKNLAAARGEHVSHACKEQVKRSSDICMNAPAESEKEHHLMESLTQSQGLRSSAENQREAYQLGHARHKGHAESCKQAIQEMHKVCDMEINEWKKKLREYSEGPSDPASEHGRHEAKLEIQSKIHHVEEYKNIAHRAMKDSQECSENYASIYSDAEAKTSQSMNSLAFTDSNSGDSALVQQASYSSESGTENASLPSQPPTFREKAIEIGHKTEVLAEKAVDKFKQPALLMTASKVVGKTLSPFGNGVAKKVSGAVSPGYHAVNEDGSVYSSTASYLASYAGPKMALRMTGVGTFLGAFLGDSQAGKCSELYLDPVHAYNQGCPVSTPKGAAANEYAIASLSKP